MERKAGIKTEVATEEALDRGLSGGAELTPEEEHVLRMRRGAKVASHEPLARAAPADSELGDELLLIEMQLLRGQRERSKAVSRPALSAHSGTKAKIVRALRKKS